MLDEMVVAGYTGTELGPYGFLPTDPEMLERELSQRKLTLLGSIRPGDLERSSLDRGSACDRVFAR